MNNPPSTRSQVSKPEKVDSPSGSFKTHSHPAAIIPSSSPRVLFPHQYSASSALFSASNDQQIQKPKTKSGPIKPPLQPIEQNNVQMEAKEKGQAQLQGLFEQVQLLLKSNNYEQLIVCISKFLKFHSEIYLSLYSLLGILPANGQELREIRKEPVHHVLFDAGDEANF